MKSFKLNIRPAQKTELKTLHSISVQTFKETFEDQNTEENMAIYLKNQLSQERINKEFENLNTVFYFAYYNEALVGYLKLNFNEAQTEAVLNGEGYEIQRFYILRFYQKKRLGSQLLEQAIKIGRNKGYKLMWLGVWELNYKALKFYKKKKLEVFDSHNFQLGDEKQTDILMKLKI